MKKPIPPCWDIKANKDCPDRHIGCFCNCERWKAYSEQKKVYDKEIRKNRESVYREIEYAEMVKQKRKRRIGLERN